MLVPENGMTVGRVEFAPDYNSAAKAGGYVRVSSSDAAQAGDNTFTRPSRMNDRAWEQWHLPPLTAANDNGKLPKVVALTGLAGSGKSTLADYLIERHGYTRVKFAGPLKAMARAIGLGEAHIEGDLKELPCAILQGKTPRFFMQQLGTQFGRDTIGEEFWTGLWSATANNILDHGGRVVCDDCRFDNEAEMVRQVGGVVLSITGRGGIAGGHASEQGVDADVVLHNVGTVTELQARADEVLFGGW
ncbi:hypothetical protein N8A98_06680 [Devosia neptuniae]|uniref:Deoxynucleotide monophosphate kinase n=1 Tax=Devosia neptuniae TaxID=191302 RepID=A0ABY6CI58_9HYPH|nr:hypothetical protein [Devosia neptuniae]UXN70866.1 hypothetical protein N8A98_06680 [Devosia neptuniae]